VTISDAAPESLKDPCDRECRDYQSYIQTLTVSITPPGISYGRSCGRVHIWRQGELQRALSPHTALCPTINQMSGSGLRYLREDEPSPTTRKPPLELDSPLDGAYRLDSARGVRVLRGEAIPAVSRREKCRNRNSNLSPAENWQVSSHRVIIASPPRGGTCLPAWNCYHLQLINCGSETFAFFGLFFYGTTTHTSP
jgi:hypothetical protein